jgi:hypothetical protein
LEAAGHSESLVTFLSRGIHGGNLRRGLYGLSIELSIWIAGETGITIESGFECRNGQPAARIGG